MAGAVYIDARHFIEDTKSQLKHYKDQIPFAASRAINDVAGIIRQRMSYDMGKHIHKPMPQTTRTGRGRGGSMFVKPSHKNNLLATIGFVPWAANYLAHVISGESTKPNPGKRHRIEPWKKTPDSFFNKFGGLRRQYFSKQRVQDSSGKGRTVHAIGGGRLGTRVKHRRKKGGSYGKYFIGVPRQHKGNKYAFGLWERRAGNKRIRKIYSLAEGSRANKKRLPFHSIGVRVMETTFTHAFETRLGEAVASRRRR